METAAPETETIERKPGLSQTIFVLEDDQDISRLVQHSLEIAGFSVRTFVSPAAVLADAERKTPDLFVLDIMVPGGDGLDLCRRIRKSPALGGDAGYFSDGADQRKRSRARTGIRRGRLHHQAFLAAGIDCADQGRAAAF